MRGKLIKRLLAISLILCITLLVSCDEIDKIVDEANKQTDAYVMFNGEVTVYENVSVQLHNYDNTYCRFTTEDGTTYTVSWVNLILVSHD